MSKKFICDICQAPMKQVERLESNKKYRIRRFKCTICDYQRTVFADDAIDSVINPNKAIKDVNRMYKNEQESRKF